MIKLVCTFFAIYTLCISYFAHAADINTVNSYNGIFQPNLQSSLIRDPFTPSRLMYEVVGSQNGLSGGAYGFIPSLGNNKIPDMKLRGFIDKGKNEPLALLEIGKSGIFLVRVGDEINTDPSNPRQAVKITSISRLSVTVQTGTLGSIRILR